MQDLLLKQVAKQFSEDTDIMNGLSKDGIAWGKAKAFILSKLPDTIEDKGTVAYNWVKRVMEIVFGKQDVEWHSYRTATSKTYIKKGKAS